MGRHPTPDRRRGLALVVPVRTALAVGLVLALLLIDAPAARADVPPFTGPAGGPKVGAVGDSILGQLQSHGPTHPHSTKAFTLSLNDQGWRASVKHRNAWRTARVRVLANEEANQGAQVVIVVTGSGDIRWVRESADPVEARKQVRRSVRLLLRDLQDQCVVWPTVPESGGAGERSTARVINEELDAADSASASVRSPEWASAAAAHPGWFIADGVHLSPTGEAAFQHVLIRAARRCLASLG